MERIIAAFATDDGQSCMDRHFGDAAQFAIFEIRTTKVNFIQNIANKVDIDETGDTHAGKFHRISDILKKDNVHVLVAKRFGANINKMKKKFVCILMSELNIAESVKMIQNNYRTVVLEWEKGKDRHFLNFKLNKRNF